MAKPLVFAMTAFLLGSASTAEHPGWNAPPPVPAPAQPSIARRVEGPWRLRLPAIGLEADLKPAKLIRGRVEDSGMKGDHPVLVPPAAHPLLGEPGGAGAVLILGHRQRRVRPLIFARLDRLAPGDQVIVTGRGLSLIYEVTGGVEIDPGWIWTIVEEISGRVGRDGASVLILVTCAPYGANWRRLLVFAACRGVRVDGDTPARSGNHPRPQ